MTKKKGNNSNSKEETSPPAPSSALPPPLPPPRLNSVQEPFELENTIASLRIISENVISFGPSLAGGAVVGYSAIRLLQIILPYLFRFLRFLVSNGTYYFNFVIVGLFNIIEWVLVYGLFILDYLSYFLAYAVILAVILVGAFYIHLTRKIAKLESTTTPVTSQIALYGGIITAILSISIFFNVPSLPSYYRYPISIILLLFSVLFLLEYPIKSLLYIIDGLVFIYTYLRGQEAAIIEMRQRTSFIRLNDARKAYEVDGDSITLINKVKELLAAEGLQ